MFAEKRDIDFSGNILLNSQRSCLLFVSEGDHRNYKVGYSKIRDRAWRLWKIDRKQGIREEEIE